MNYPSIPLVVPSDLNGVQNGNVPPTKLHAICIGGKLWTWAAFCFDIMASAAKKDKIVFQNEGDYRPFAKQLDMFYKRYSLKDEGRVPQITRKFQGKTWYLKKGESPSAVPGTSNHGLGLAIDLKVSDPKVAAWLCENAPTYGFYLQGSDPHSPEFELWHWQYCVGNVLPDPAKKLLDYLKAVKK